MTDDRIDILPIRSSNYTAVSNLTKDKILSLLNVSKQNTINPSYANFDFDQNLPLVGINIRKYLIQDKKILFYPSPRKPTTFTEGFNDAFSKMEPKDLVEKYGTHIITSLYQGCYFFWISYIENEQPIDLKKIKRNWKNLVFASGSDVSKIITTDSIVDFTDYLKGYNPENSQFVGFSDQNNQTPIYELLPNGEKKEALKKYIEEYLEGKFKS